jgi:RNA-binding protein YlmH
MLPREELLKRVENREIVARIIDLAEQAIKTWEIVETDFLSPYRNHRHRWLSSSRAATLRYLSE